MNREREQLQKLQREIISAIVGAEADGTHPAVIFTALQNAIMFYMTRVCPAYRRAVARRLKAKVPVMLKAADQFAAKAAQLVLPSSPTTPH
jgi:hypothetical protein